jgi:CRP/FNR family transcriptional regulator, dissimilatory nitrate respiration regulator
MSRTALEVLRDCPLFSKVPQHGFERLANMAQTCQFRKGQWIFREGEECPGTYIVGDGLVRVFKTAASGKEHVLHIVGPGKTFAEVATIGGFPCPANAEAIAPTTCVLLPMEPFRKSLQDDHALCMGLMVGMSNWVKHLIGLMEDIVLRDAAGRLARFLLDSKHGQGDTVELPSLKRHVANHLNLTSETFSRVLRRFFEAELILDLDDNRIRLLDLERLQTVAQGLAPKF